MTMKKTKGRQKIEIKKITKKTDRMITFSKRKSGIYKKINELSTLCGAEIAFLAFSAAGNPFTFGSPSFEAIAERFMNEDDPAKENESTPLHSSILHAHKKIRLNELSEHYSGLIDELEAEKERTKTLTPMISQAKKEKAPADEWWRADPTAVEDKEALVEILTKFEDLYENLCDLMVQKTRAACASSKINIHGFENGEGSETYKS